MTKEQYIKMNRGINDSRDLPPEFLSKIYDEIKNEEIKLKTSNNTNKRLTNSNPSEKQREISLSVQMKDVEDVARDLMSSAGSIQEEFTSAKHHEHVRPMFQVRDKKKPKIPKEKQKSRFSSVDFRNLGRLV